MIFHFIIQIFIIQIALVITAPDDVRPVLKSYADKYIPQAFADYQEELRAKFNEEHKEKMSRLHLKSKFYFYT